LARLRVLRRGTASLEAILTIGIVVPIAYALMVLGMRACRQLFHVIGTLVGWPYL
jgi:hypothetical protein